MRSALRERGIHAPLVAVTGDGQDTDLSRALSAGFFDEHVVKPVSLAKVQTLIDKLTGPAAA